ncbi:MAG TPA: hypothetical protein VIY52_30800 [Streptosporangiaceae bacterium]
MAAELAELRERGPVVPAELPDGTTAWLVSGFEEVRQLFVDQCFARALAARPARAKRGLEMAVAETLVGMDAPGAYPAAQACDAGLHHATRRGIPAAGDRDRPRAHRRDARPAAAG